MKKIISLFARNYCGDRLVRDEVVPGAEWVLAGEGVATQKFDGTCCLVRDGRLFKRYELGRGRTPPAGFEPATDEEPPVGEQQGWVPVGDGPEDRWHREAWQNGIEEAEAWGVPEEDREPPFEAGTYELVGPKVQGNPEGFKAHDLVRHGCFSLPNCPRTFAALRDWLATQDIEGVVWWRDLDNPNCDKVKIKKKDFGLSRKPVAARTEAGG